MAAGGELVIDDKFLQSLKRMDDVLQGITDSASDADKSMQKWLSKLNDNSVLNFVEHLSKIASQYRLINETLKDVDGFKDFARKADEANTAIQSLINNIRKTERFNLEIDVEEGLKELKAISDHIDEMIQQEKELAKEEADTHKQRQQEYDELGRSLKEYGDAMVHNFNLLTQQYEAEVKLARKEQEATERKMEAIRKFIEARREAEQTSMHTSSQRDWEEQLRQQQEADEQYAKQVDARRKEREKGIEDAIAFDKREEEERQRRLQEQQKQEEKARQERIKQEEKAESERYQTALARMHAETKEHKRSEEEKVRATREAIKKQNEAMAEANARAQASQQVKQKAEQARQAYEKQMSDYAKLFDEADAKDKDKLEKSLDNYRKYYTELQRLAEEYAQLFDTEKQAVSVGVSTDAIEERKKALINLQFDLMEEMNKISSSSTEAKKRSADIEQEIDASKRLVKTKKEIAEATKRQKEEEEAQRKRLGEAANGAIDFANALMEISKAQTKLKLQGKTSYDEAMGGYSFLFGGGGAKSLSNLREVQRALEDAKSKQDRFTESGKKRCKELNDALEEVKNTISAVSDASDETNESHNKLMDTSGQLMRQLALVFSVSQIEGYVNKLVSVRKEFELQQRSLQALLQNKQAANEIWNQTVQLALKSPFRVKDLVTYTKELAAYRIETEKLHDTTKMLADVSAGLGVDMSRLILAFGQVRAAEFLRGTELRQFTEAGIPMLEELADHFSALEGRAVSTADVFERISKRMVVFADVEAVFEKLTSAGGAFYKMQEKQSETLYGSISNLHDAIDIMLNDIGKSHDGLIKGSVAFARKMVDNWKTLATVIKVAAGALALYKLNAILTSKALIRMAVATNITTASNVKCLSVTQLLRLSFVRLGKSISAAGKAMKTFLLANPIAASIMAVVAALIELNNVISDHEEQLEEIDKRYRELKEQVSEIHVNFIYSDNIEDRREELAKLIEFANNELGMRIDVKASEVEESKVESEFYRIQGLVLDTQAALNEWERKWAEVTHWTAFDDLFENIETLDKYLNRNSSILINNRARLVEYLKQLGLLSVEAKKALEPLREGESQYEYAARLSKAFDMAKKEIIGLKGGLYGVDKDIYNIFTDLNKDLSIWTPYQWNVTREAKKQFLKAVEEMRQDLERLTPEERGVRITALIDKMATEKEWSSFVQGELKQWFTEIPELPITFTAKLPSEQSIDPWKGRVTAAVQKLNERIQKELDDNAPKTLFPVPTENDSLESWLNRYKEAISEIKTDFVDGQEIFDADYVKDKNALKPYTKEAETIANITEKTTKNEKDANAILNKRISLIKEMHSAYEKERKLWDEETSEKRVLQSYRLAYEDAFGKNIHGYNFKIKEGVAKELQELIPLAEKAGKEAIIALERAIASTEVESGDLEKKLKDEKLIRQVEDMFGTYELSLELKDMNIPSDLAEQLFGFESLDLEGLKDKLKEFEPRFIGTDREEKYRDYLQKVENMEAKALEERMKKYAKFLEQEQTERVKIKLNEVRQLMEIEDTFRIHEKDAREKFEMTNEQWKAYEEQRKKGKEINLEFLKGLGIEEEKAQAILEQNRLLAEQKQLAYTGVNRTTQEQLDKDTWESFKKSGYYEMMFSDLEHLGTKAIDSLYEKLSNMQDALKQLPPEVYKEIQSTIDKVESIKLERNPFEALRDAWKEVRDLNKNGIEIDIADPFFGVSAGTKNVKGEEEIAEEYARQEARLTQLREEEAIVAAVLAVKQGTATIDQQQLTQTQEAQGYLDKQESDLNVILKGKQKEKKLTEQNTKKLKEGVDEYQEMSEAVSASWKKTEQWAEAIKNTADATDALLDSLGVAEDSATRIAVQAVSMTADMILNVVQLQIQFKAAGIAANDMLGIIGWIAMGLQAVAKIFTFIFGLKDARLQKQIENIEADVESLEKSLQRLEKQMEEVYSISSIMFAHNEAQNNIEEQIDGYRSMIELEKQKKKTDVEKIKEWNEEIEKLQERQKELEVEREKALGGFGGNADYKEASEAFVDAWMTAFRETGNGLSGLEEKMDEYFANMVKKQLLGRGVEKLMANFYTEWDNMVGEDGYFDSTEMDKARSLMDEYGIRLNNYLTSATAALGVSDELMGKSQLGTLQKGIQGITEDQADVLSAYLNSIRFMVGESNGYLKIIASNYSNGDTPNPMLGQLQLIANQATAINDLLSSVTKAGHKEGGYGIKVFTD